MNTAERRWELQQNAERLVQELLRRGWKTAAAESCTGGMVTQALTSVPGASGVLDYGVITYSNAVKQRELGVSGESLEAFGAVSRTVALQMAEGVARKAPAEMGLSTTGIAGPGGGTPQKPVGTVHICVWLLGQARHRQLNLLDECGNDREAIRETAVLRLLELALSVLAEAGETAGG